MLHRERTIVPKTVCTQNELIDAMKQKEIVIYIVGDYANEVKKKLKGSKFARFLKGTGKVGLVAIPIVAFFGGPVGWGAMALAAGTVGVGKIQDDFDNYDIELKNKDTNLMIILKKVKGPDKFNAEYDTIAQ